MNAPSVRLPGWYGALATLLEPIALGWGQGGDREAVRARRGLDAPRGEAWIHAASVGEASGVPPLVSAWRERRGGEALIASALTPGGRASLRRVPGLAVTAPPYDTLRAARRAVRGSGVRRLLLLETEIWPAWIAAALESGVAVAVANGRLSDRAWPRYRRFADRLRPLLASFTAVAAQTQGDAERWVALGAVPERVRVTGNTKHDATAALEPPSAAQKAEASRRLGLSDDCLWCVWGSLRPGEERWVEAALARAPESVRFLVVPRHPEKWSGRTLPGQESGRASWILSLGVLADAYRAGDLAVIGGTLEGYGGHNALEPAALGLPVLLGPSVENLRDSAAVLVASGGARAVSGPAELADAITAWSADAEARRAAGAAARRSAMGLGGASARVLDWLETRGWWA